MKILYDFQIFEEQKVGGVSRYFFELMKQFENKNETSVLFPMFCSTNYYLKKGYSFKSLLRKIDDFEFKGKYRICNFLKSFSEDRLRKISQNRNYDLFHPTYYYNFPAKEVNPYVITVHDMIHELFCEQYEALNGQKFMKRKKEVILNAARIIAISEQTKSDLLSIYGEQLKDKIDVVYHGSPFSLKIKKKENPLLHTKYILFVGGRKLYKNFTLFLKAIAPLLNNELHLICVGGEFDEEEKELIASVYLTDYVKAKKVTDQELINLYQNARLFVFPSLYEGFGFPILEAFSCGCPVATSNRSSLAEVAGEAATFFDPESETSIYETVTEVLKSPSLRNELKTKGFQRLQFFSWEKCAAQTLLSYQKALTQL